MCLCVNLCGLLTVDNFFRECNAWILKQWCSEYIYVSTFSLVSSLIWDHFLFECLQLAIGVMALSLLNTLQTLYRTDFLSIDWLIFKIKVCSTRLVKYRTIFENKNQHADFSGLYRWSTRCAFFISLNVFSWNSLSPDISEVNSDEKLVFHAKLWELFSCRTISRA